ncbi:hypothetical protein E8E11_010331 [Didymella keratinophila]|nr:hypothetical protein E8E11_010331 [Didymella keratinophila]
MRMICGIASTHTSYRKILAILLLINRPDRIASFIESEVSDADLPLLSIPRKKDPSGATFKLRCSRNPQKSLPCLKWKQSAVARFEEHQWVVLAPIFHRTIKDPIPHLVVSPKQPLPFTQWERAAEPGACGQVFRVAIHSAHHNFPEPEAPHGVVAVKQLFSKKRDQFDSEVEILKRISRENHTNKHLIKLLATYEHNDEFHMIFPYAKRDLETYWRLENPKPIQSEKLAHWLINQCQGLAEGLARIHRYGTESPNAFMKVDSKTASASSSRRIGGATNMHWFSGRHGDIKPANILWFPHGSHGILKITDFGIARFTGQDQESQRGRDHPPNSVTYRSPECDDPEGQLSSMCDVWALGCVYLVFVTWFTGGYDYVEQFARERSSIDEGWFGFTTDSFFTVINGEARVKDSVVSMIEKLKRESWKIMSEVF